MKIIRIVEPQLERFEIDGPVMIFGNVRISIETNYMGVLGDFYSLDGKNYTPNHWIIHPNIPIIVVPYSNLTKFLYKGMSTHGGTNVWLAVV